MNVIRDGLVVFWFVFWSFTITHCAEKREISVNVKECPTNLSCHGQSIIHVSAAATDNSSTIHYLWTTYPIPTIIVAYTTLNNVSLTINWQNLTGHDPKSSIVFHPPVNYTFGFALTRLYEFEDIHDEVDPSNHGKIFVHDFAKDFNWSMKHDNSTNTITFTGNKTFSFECIASDSEGRESLLPHALHTADSSRFFVTIDNATLHANTSKIRFTLEMMYIDNGQQKPLLTTERTIDDEYTPAVFETVYGKVGKVHGKGVDKGYSQWKPIAYTDPTLGRKYQTRASAGDINDVKDLQGERSWSIAKALMSGSCQRYCVNVTFGLAKDGFYEKTNYLTWSGIVGYGEPANSSLSFLVILISIIGLGMPILVIILGGTYFQVRKRCCKKVSTTYARIN